MAPARDKTRTAKGRLVEEGARSYLDAVNALIEFQKEVQKASRLIIERNIEEYSTALKIRLKAKELREFAWPELAEWDGTYWSLGTEIIRRNVIPSVRWWQTTCGFGIEDSGLACWVAEWFPTRRHATALHQKFDGFNPKVQLDGYGVWIHHDVRIEEAATFEEPLGALFEEWIRLWTKVGGMKEAFKG